MRVEGDWGWQSYEVSCLCVALVSRTCVCVLKKTTSRARSTTRGKGEFCGPRTFTVARQAPRFAVSQILFGLVDFKLKFRLWVGIPGVCLAGVLLGVGKYTLGGEALRGVSRLPWVLVNFFGNVLYKSGM